MTAVSSASAACLAAALLVMPAPVRASARLRGIVNDPTTTARRRLAWLGSPTGRRATLATLAWIAGFALAGWPSGILLATLAAPLTWWLVRRRQTRGRRGDVPGDQLRLAAAMDLLAACLRAGIPVSTAVRSAAGSAPPQAAAALRSAADLLALGADPIQAWTSAADCASTAEFARAARRTTRSGAALADAAAKLAARTRAVVDDHAEARAQRAAVLVTGPLGLCFLPAFLCLGVAPVVLGLAGRLDLPG